MPISDISPLAFLATLSGSISKLIVAPMAFTEHPNLVVRTLGLAISNQVTIDHAKTIWAHEQAFSL